MGATFGILMTSYNKPQWVGRAIESILAQTFTEWNLWLIDDGSSEETLEVLQSFKDSRIHFFSEKDAPWDRSRIWRPCAIFNKYIPLIIQESPWLLRISDDDTWHKHLLETVDEFLKTRPFVRVAYVWADVWVAGKFDGPRDLNPYRCTFGPHRNPKGLIDGNAQIFHREVFQSLAPPWFREELTAETYIVDGEFAQRVAKHFIFYHVPSSEPLYHHWITPQSWHTRLLENGQIACNALVTVDKLIPRE